MYPAVENHGDFTEIERSEPIDLLVGGTPCQSFSVAGKRAGLDDARGNLTLEFLALADRLRPRWLVWENVPGVLSDDGGRTFGTVLGILGQFGYGFAYRVLDAQHFGVPQRRRRVFVVGYLGDWRRAAAVLFERASLSGNPPPSRETGKDVAGSLGGGSGERGWYDDTDRMTFVPETVGALSDGAHMGGGLNGQDVYTGRVVVHSLRADGFDASEDGTGRGTPIIPIQSVQAVREKRQNGIGIGEEGDPIFTMTGRDQHAIAFDYKQSGEVNPTMRSLSHDKSHANNGSHLAVALPLGARVDRGGSHREAEGNNLVAYNRNIMGTGELAPTLNTAGGSGSTACVGVRRLTPVECEKLQGFEPNYTLIPYRGKPASDGPRYRALGNSMAIPVVRWIGERIQMVEDLRRAEERQQA